MMPYTRARAAARVTSATLRPVTCFLPANGFGVLITRAIIASSMAAFGPPLRGASVVTVDIPTPGGRVMGEWVRSRGARDGGAVVLYLHGSGFVACSPKTHHGMTSRLSALTGLPVFATRYRRAPRHRFPAASDDALASYRLLVAEGHRDIVVAGDSAGGHLAVDLALTLARNGEQAPRGLVLFSPLYDVTFGLSAEREKARRDPMISAARARTLIEHYTRDADLGHERLRLAVRTSRALPPVLIQAGGAEMLSADAEQLAADIVAAGGTCDLEVWPEQMHVFQAMPALVPEARLAMRVAAAFVKQVTAATTSHTAQDARPARNVV